MLILTKLIIAKRRFLGACVIFCVLSTVQFTQAQQASIGSWQTLTTIPINPIHAALMNNGKILIVSGNGYNKFNTTNFLAGIFDPVSGTTTQQNIAQDMFCGAMAVTPDGRPISVGGTQIINQVFARGIQQTSIFSPSTGVFGMLQSMAHGRWYPTTTTLSDGRVMVFSGNEANGSNGVTNNTVELFTPCLGWSQEYVASFTPTLYPRLHLLPNGTVFNSAPNDGTSPNIFNPSNQTWTAGPVRTDPVNVDRTYGTSVLLPLTPANNYSATIMIMGGAPFSPYGIGATSSTAMISFTPSPQAWVTGPPMTQPRVEHQATILPTGKILVYGGSAYNECPFPGNQQCPNPNELPTAEIYDPTINAFKGVAGNTYFHLYHSTGLLLPDARVVLMGSNPGAIDGSFENHVEIYSPPYLFNSNGSLASRPTISSVPAGAIAYGTTFQVQTPDATNISSVALMRPGAVTHSFDMEQRMLNLSFLVDVRNGLLNITAPPSGAIAPPGYYMLFLVNSAGVPSVAQFVQLLDNSTLQYCKTPLTISQIASHVSQTGQGNLFYLNSADHVIQVIPNTGVTQDLTVLSSGVVAATGSKLFSFDNRGAAVAVYQGSNQHIYQIYFSGSNWINKDLTAMAGTTVVGVPGTPLTAFLNAPSESYFYLGTANHVYELLWNGSSMSNLDLTALSGGPPAISGSGLSSYNNLGSEVVVYQGANQHIYGIFHNGSQWTDSDYTAMASTTVVGAPGTPLTSFLNSPSEFYFYLGTDSHVYELLWNGSNMSNLDLTPNGG